MNTTIQRLPDWESRLTQFLTECRMERITFDWDNFNCVSFAADAVEAMTGVDLYEPYRDLDTPLKLIRRVQELGVGSHIEVVSRHFQEKPVVYAHRGDIAVVAAERPDASEGAELAFPNGVDIFTEALGVFDPPFIWALNDKGVGYIPQMSALRAFAVGDL
jgi:hypothetical protein